MSSQPQIFITPEEDLARERQAEHKVEVLSDLTKDYDRGDKFEHYRGIPSFIEYVLISQDKHHVEHFVRQPDNRWILAETNHLEDTITLTSIQCVLALGEVYDKVDVLGH